MNISEIMKRLELLITSPIVPWIAKSRLTPNILTWIGLVLTIVTASVIAMGNLFLGGFLVLLSGFFDMMDGSLARFTNKSTRFGAFLDSTVDRFSEAMLLLGLLIYHLGISRQELFVGAISLGSGTAFAALLIFVVLTFSFLTSYTRARAEGLGIACQVGVFPRAGRVILLALGLIFDLALCALLIIALLGFVTVVQRVVHVWRHADKSGRVNL